MVVTTAATVAVAVATTAATLTNSSVTPIITSTANPCTPVSKENDLESLTNLVTDYSGCEVN